MDTPWFTVRNVDEVPSPALLFYPDRIEENVRRMLALVGSPARLRPHMKTHKVAEVIRLQLQLGVSKFKCATIAETEMVADCGAPDIVLAYQPVGPNVQRLLTLVRKFPQTTFAAIADDADAIRALGAAFAAAGLTLNLFLDVDSGMHRTGVAPGDHAVDLYKLIAQTAGLKPAGLHAYDGHNHETDLAVRTAMCESNLAPVVALRRQLTGLGLSVPKILAGGTPTFPLYAKSPEVAECSPGTCVLWDFGYERMLPDMKFLVAAVVLTRVISKPGTNRLCLDLGHKAIAAENPHPRVFFPQLPDATAVMHSEEHLVVETPRAGEFAVGDCLYGVPRHICPTVALHSEVVVVRNGLAGERWKVLARARQITV